MLTNGQAVKIAHYTRSKFNSLTNKDSATIYYVEETDGKIKQYIGNTHVVSDITKAEIEAKLTGAITTHTHPISQVTGLQGALDGKAAIGHTHTYNLDQISDGATYKRVTETDKNNWNFKADITDIESAIGVYDGTLSPIINGKLSASLKGSANGLAELDGNGKVPSTQLPSFVDDVLEFASLSKFPTTGESGKIYIDLATNKTYRWGGSDYVVISETIALGETSSTAYRGDRGKIAYDHSQVAHAPSNAQKNSDITQAEIEAKLKGLITTHTHNYRPAGNVPWTEVSSKPTFATVATSGSYADLSNKPTIPSLPSIMTTTEGNTGTATTRRTINAANLKSIILNHSPAGARPSSWEDVTGKPTWIGASKPLYTHDEVGARSENWYPSWDDVTSKPTITVSGTTDGIDTTPKAISESVLKATILAVSPAGARPASSVVLSNISVDTINGHSHGNAMLRQLSGGQVAVGSDARQLRLTGNTSRPYYTTSSPVTTQGTELALLSDIKWNQVSSKPSGLLREVSFSSGSGTMIVETV